jgi:hypothetical protein
MEGICSMALDTSTPRSRRTILAATLGAAAASVVQAVARPLGVRAAGSDGSPILVGSLILDAQTGTYLSNQANNSTVLSAVSSSAAGFGGGTAFLGKSNTGFGVLGVANNGSGVVGRSASSGGVGVEGTNTVGTGLAGISDSGAGIRGASNFGTGVACRSNSGAALEVAGRARFSRAGRASIPARKTFVDVVVEGGLDGTSSVLATLQVFRAGVSVAAARPNFPSSGKARIYLNKVASTTAATPIAWFVFD